jgi:hypothetical protein
MQHTRRKILNIPVSGLSGFHFSVLSAEGNSAADFFLTLLFRSVFLKNFMYGAQVISGALPEQFRIHCSMRNRADTFTATGTGDVKA